MSNTDNMRVRKKPQFYLSNELSRSIENTLGIDIKNTSFTEYGDPSKNNYRRHRLSMPEQSANSIAEMCRNTSLDILLNIAIRKDVSDDSKSLVDINGETNHKEKISDEVHANSLQNVNVNSLTVYNPPLISISDPQLNRSNKSEPNRLYKKLRKKSPKNMKFEPKHSESLANLSKQNNSNDERKTSSASILGPVRSQSDQCIPQSGKFQIVLQFKQKLLPKKYPNEGKKVSSDSIGKLPFLALLDAKSIRFDDISSINNQVKDDGLLAIEIFISDFEFKVEELLEDVLYSVHSLMGNMKGNSTWFVPAERNVEQQQDATVSLEEITSEIRRIFQVSDDTMNQVWQNVRKKKAPDLSLYVKVIGAKALRPKTVRGGSNPFAIISLINSTESRRTRLEHETLNPTWNQDFSLKVNNLYWQQLQIQVWHEHHLVDVEQVTSIRDIRGLTRLVKETNATLANKEEAHLLGEAKVHLNELKGGSYAQWIQLQKESCKDSTKERGSVLIQIEVGAMDCNNSDGRRNSLDSLLARLIYAHIKGYSTDEKQEEMKIPWAGQLSAESKAILNQHSIILGLREYTQNISWWIIPSKLPSVDTGWLFGRLKKIQQDMSKGLYEKIDLELLSDSFVVYHQLAMHKLINIQTSFPTSSEVLSRHQLAYMLKILKNLQETSKTRGMLESKSVPNLIEQSKIAVLEHTKIWWTKLMDEQLTDVVTTEEQIKKIIFISNETFYFLANIAVFYSPVLLSEMNIAFFREAYILLTRKINACVRPLLINVFSKTFEVEATSEECKDFSLEYGSPVWQLYVNTSRIYQLGLELPLDVRENSGIHEYYRWFNKGMLRFLEIAVIRSEQMIKRAVEMDNFEPIDEYCNFSSSSTDINGIFIELRLWWQKLAWPDPENSGVLLAKLLEDICSCGIIYSDLLRSKVDEFFTEHSNTKEANLISKQICIGLNNIERIRLELTTLPKQFLVNDLCEKIRSSPSGGEYASNVFRNNISSLIDSSTENMENKVTQFIETVIERMIPILHDAVMKAVEEESEQHLLAEMLDPSLHLLKDKLDDYNFMHVLRRLWEVVIDVFQQIVNRNINKRKASYFGVIDEILKKILQFFSPSVGVGLSRDESRTTEYLELSNIINSLRLSSENLISKYYMERYKEQNMIGACSTAELVVRALFTKIGKLHVEVIMAKNMALNNDMNSSNAKLHLNPHPVDSYVKVQFLPSEWFPHVVEKKTKTLRKSDPAVYEENFEFDLSNSDNGVSEGIILFTLKDYNIGRSNTFIGEAVLPFKLIPCVDSSEVHTVRNTFLKMTVPAIESGYKTLLVLKQRNNDKIAATFSKKVISRFPEYKSKGINIFSHSSDEEKPMHGKSPILLRKKK